jgi:hypothetical protein
LAFGASQTTSIGHGVGLAAPRVKKKKKKKKEKGGLALGMAKPPERL